MKSLTAILLLLAAPAIAQDTQLVAYSKQLQAGETVTHRGPLVIDQPGYLIGVARSHSRLVIEGGGEIAVHITAPDVTVRDVFIDIRGDWQCGIQANRPRADIGIQSLLLEHVTISGHFAVAAFYSRGAEVCTLFGCVLQNRHPGEAVYKTDALEGDRLISNSTIRLLACSFLAHADTRCVFRVGTGTHDLVIRDADVGCAGNHEACFIVGTEGYEDQSSDVIGHLVIDSGHYETAFHGGRGCRHFMRRVGKTFLRDAVMRDFHAMHLAQAAYVGFDGYEFVTLPWTVVRKPKGVTVERHWFIRFKG